MKVLVKNALGDVVQNSYLPMTAVNAATFCADIMEGTYSIYEEGTKVGSDVGVTLAYDTQVQIRNSVTGKKTYLRFIAKSTANPDEIQTTLTGLTVNGILIDEVVIIAFRPMAFA